MDDPTDDRSDSATPFASVSETEEYVHELTVGLLASPAPECLVCYVARMVEEYGCDQHSKRFAIYWRDHRVPHIGGLERRLDSLGAFCDCRVLANAWRPRGGPVGQSPHGRYPWEPRPCAGVGPRTSQPCSLWQRRRRPPRVSLR